MMASIVVDSDLETYSAETKLGPNVRNTSKLSHVAQQVGLCISMQ